MFSTLFLVLFKSLPLCIIQIPHAYSMLFLFPSFIQFHSVNWHFAHTYNHYIDNIQFPVLNRFQIICHHCAIKSKKLTKKMKIIRMIHREFMWFFFVFIEKLANCFPLKKIWKCIYIQQLRNKSISSKFFHFYNVNSVFWKIISILDSISWLMLC